MPNLFGRSSPFDEAVDKICDIGTENDDWQLIMNLCDIVNTTANGPKVMVKALVKKIKNADHMALEHAVTLLDACVNNCKRPFHLELCTREILNDLKQYLQKNRTPTKGVNNLKEAMVKWSKAFGEDPQLYLLSVTVMNLKGEGVVFPTDTTNAPPVNLPGPPTSSSRQACESEEDMIKKAIELSLKETQGKSGGGASGSSLYPSFTADKPLSTDRELFKVKALYDFEAAEENEITFKAGDMVSVTDNSDQNWWKGRTPSSAGMFPANFVTKQLDSPPEPPPVAQPQPVKVTEVNPQQIDLLLEMLRKADATVTNEEEDKFIAELEESIAQQQPLVEAEYNKLKGKHEELESINDDMSRVVGLFHKLLKEAPPVQPVQAPQPIRYSYQPVQPQPVPPMQQGQGAGGAPDQRHYAPPTSQMYNGPAQYDVAFNPHPSNMQPGPPPPGNYSSASPPPSYHQPPPQGSHQPPPQGSHHPPPQGSHHPPPQGSHHPPPQGSHHPPPQGSHPGYYPVYPGQQNIQPPVYSQPAPQFTSQPNIAHVSPMAQSGATGTSMQ